MKQSAHTFTEPMERSSFFCSDCGRELWGCECNSGQSRQLWAGYEKWLDEREGKRTNVR